MKKKEESLFEQVKREFLASEKIPLKGYFFINWFCCLAYKDSRKYRQILNKSKSRLAKEMDMQKFLHR